MLTKLDIEVIAHSIAQEYLNEGDDFYFEIVREAAKKVLTKVEEAENAKPTIP